MSLVMGGGWPWLVVAAVLAGVVAGRVVRRTRDEPAAAELAAEEPAAVEAEHPTIKANAASMLFHTTESPYYGRTKADAWFSSEDDARAAGFSRWDEH